MTNRRGFLSQILGLSIAPAVVRASSLMRVSGIIVPSQEIIIPAGAGLLSIEMITREALRILSKELCGARQMRRYMLEGREFD